MFKITRKLLTRAFLKIYILGLYNSLSNLYFYYAARVPSSNAEIIEYEFI